MKKIIHHIRRQPEHIKTHILHVVTVGLGLLLLGLWVFSLGVTLANPEAQSKFSNDIKPFTTLKDNFLGGLKSITGDNTASTNTAVTQ